MRTIDQVLCKAYIMRTTYQVVLEGTLCVGGYATITRMLHQKIILYHSLRGHYAREKFIMMIDQAEIVGVGRHS